MTDKAREEFEAWAEIYHKAQGNWYDRDAYGGMFATQPDGEYQVRWLQSDFEAWNASRAALVIQIPVFDDYPASIDADMRESLRTVVEASGLRCA